MLGGDVHCCSSQENTKNTKPQKQNAGGRGKARDVIVGLQLNFDWLVLSLPLLFSPSLFSLTGQASSCWPRGFVLTPQLWSRTCGPFTVSFRDYLGVGGGGQSLGPIGRCWS